MSAHGHEECEIHWTGRVGPRVAAAIGAVAGMAASRRRLKGALVGGAVGWVMAHFINKRHCRKETVVDVGAGGGSSESQANV
jgi:hypothetical protein